MSEQTPGRRRIAARIVPIARITPAALPLVQPSRGQSQGGATSRDSSARQRVYGAPLTDANRLHRPAQKSVRTVFQNVMSEAGAAFNSDVIDLPLRRGDVDGAEADVTLAGEVLPLILWEQPPQPQDLSPPNIPRWAENVSLVPNEQEFSELSKYLVFLVDGFARFCRSPDVMESGSWQARIPMPPAVLPDTTLDLNLSPLLVGLRFETQHRVSRDLLGRYVGGLKAQLFEALGKAREVEVSLW